MVVKNDDEWRSRMMKNDDEQLVNGSSSSLKKKSVRMQMIMMCREFEKRFKHFPAVLHCSSVSEECSRVANYGTLWTLHTESCRENGYTKQITTREVLSGFYGNPVYFGTSTFFPLLR